MNIKFKNFFDSFKNTKMWKDMAMAENSPWHRESSIQKHTEMILEYYFTNLADKRSEREQALTFLAILFHDVGKPVVMEVREDEAKGGEYKSFRNHELRSARMWEDYACQNWFKWQKLQQTFGLKDTDFVLIQWCIENHLWYRLKHRDQIATVLTSSFFGSGTLANVFLDLCESDTNGRISDTREQELYQFREFRKQLNELIYERLQEQDSSTLEYDSKPTLAVLIGASGAGKSTTSNMFKASGFSYHSLDDLRLKFAAEKGVVGKSEPDTYSKAFDYCGIHRGPFRKYADNHFESLLAQQVSVVIDNTNTSEKSRSDYIFKAKKAGYEILCILFPIEKSKLLDRQKTRKDKLIPQVAVLDQYNKTSVPWLGIECDSLSVRFSNLDGYDENLA